MKQYLPKKPTKRGFKIWVRADSRNGFFCDFEVYVGKSDDRREHGLGGSVVMKLSETIAGKNHHIYCDNYFTSAHLLLELLDHKLYCCGTTNMSRRGFPDDLKILVLQRGEYEFRQHGNLVAFAWKDKRIVTVLSTLSPPDQTQLVPRKEKDGTITQVPCPHAVATYNRHMGGVDRGDQMRQYYCVRPKSSKYYKYIFWFTFEISIANAYILSQFSPNTSLLSSHRHLKRFRLRLAEQLIGQYCTKKRPGRPRSIHIQPTAPTLHLPSHQASRSTCVYCRDYRQTDKRHRSIWYCPDCVGKPTLCLTGLDDGSCCYKRWHTALALRGQLEQ